MTPAAPSNAASPTAPGDPIMAEKGGYKHFMQKEFFESAARVRDTLLGRIRRTRKSLSSMIWRITAKHSGEFHHVRMCHLAEKSTTGTPVWPQNS